MKPLGSSRKQLSCDRITLIGEQHIEPDNRMAYLLDREIYQETEDIALGKIKKTPLLSELSDWFTSMYSVKILNIQFDELKGSNTNRYGLHVIIQNTEDYQKMYDRLGDRPNEEYQRQIGLEFKRIALRYNFVDKTKLDDLFVIYNDFSREAKTMANRRAAKEVRTYIKSTHVSVWEVETQFWGSVVFYYLDYDVINNENTGTSKSITNDYYAILKNYDELNYFTTDNIRLNFDSKENLDKNYEGNLFYYSR